MNFEEIIKTQKKLLKELEELKEDDSFFLIVIGGNGSGKTTLLNSIAQKYKNVGKYTINENRQFTTPNPFEPKQYKKSILSKLMSSGESLYEEISDNLDEDILIFDEPTATLDLFNTSLVVESFIRHLGKIKVISTNDYLTLKLLNGYINTAYNCETGKMEKIKDFLDNMVDKTINELINSPFEQLNINTYKKLR